MYVPLVSLQRAVALVDDLADLDDPADFARIALPGLSRLVGGEVATGVDTAGVGTAAPRRSPDELIDADRELLDALRGPLLSALRRAHERRRARTALDLAATPDGLTARERQVLDLVGAGRTNSAIAHELGISPRTVAKHLEHVYRKLGVANRAAAAWVACAQNQPSRISSVVRSTASRSAS
ncbi:helix-turn-helix transcriptional regulator [Pseudonocardia sp. H11422]|uniref:helix-turn-helix transcriptional regulator n=1 Tax=Pseudonocardia sp. H11422 TaxID=2835866 RepID=UPI0027E35020|nr:LuxR C-terminal-related transcriptional regulator [Pseudonocardia sp. H11422]